MNEIVVVGVGNPFRGDDGAGWAVVDDLKGKLPSHVDAIKQDGNIFELLEIFKQYPVVYLIDACLTSEPVGSWKRLDALSDPILLDAKQTSTHGLNISQAIALGKNLSQLPSQLIVYAISANNFQMNTSLSPLVAKAIPDVVQALEKDILSCMKKA